MASGVAGSNSVASAGARDTSNPGVWLIWNRRSMAGAFRHRMTNSAPAFVSTQVYVGMGYYVLGAVAAFDAVPLTLQKQAALLGFAPWKVFLRVTLPLSRLGLAVALSIAWVRAIGEFGAVVVTAYYPAGMPVQLWVNLQSFGLPAVMPLMVVFLAVALPLPWLVHVLAQRRRHA